MNRTNAVGRVVKSQFVIGLDLGQGDQRSAIAVVERAEVVGEWDQVYWAHRREVELRLRDLERMEAGLKVREVEERLAEAMGSEALRGSCELVVAANGVGEPVVGRLQSGALGQAGMKITGVMLTTGKKARRDEEMHRVAKRDLIVELQLLLDDGDLRIPEGLRYMEELKKEMADMRYEDGEQGSWRVGEHDDLVLALALAYWGAGNVEDGMGDGHWVGQREWRRSGLR